MYLSNNVNKENFRLLDVSSDEDSEDLQLEIIPSRKKKVTKRDRSKIQQPKSQEPNLETEIQCAVRWAMRGTLLLWLLMLTWICAALYDQVTSMRKDIARVSKSSAIVSDTVQVCHTAAQELRSNASDLNRRLQTLEQEHQELAKRVNQAAGELAAVSEQLSAAPKLADTPKRLAELQRLVAEFGSQINGFDGALATTRKQAFTAASEVDKVKNQLQVLESRTNDTIANVSTNFKHDDELRQQFSTLNNTLEAKVEDLQSRIEELKKPASTASPTTPASTTSSTTSTTPTPVTVAPPGPPAKPSVLGNQ